MLSNDQILKAQELAKKILIRESADSQLGLMCTTVIALARELLRVNKELSDKGWEMDAMRDRARQV